jgi:hypothetical protein
VLQVDRSAPKNLPGWPVALWVRFDGREAESCVSAEACVIVEEGK